MLERMPERVLQRAEVNDTLRSRAGDPSGRIEDPNPLKIMPQNAKTPPPEGDGVLCIEHRMRSFSVLCRPGSDLLSQGLSHSTIGAE
ncbi:MAG: hypothetical protein ACRCV5_08695, partial [Afipia sp.]